jgi:hypothetical protein
MAIEFSPSNRESAGLKRDCEDCPMYRQFALPGVALRFRQTIHTYYDG